MTEPIAIPLALRPMHTRPVAGQRLTVLLKDGTQLDGCLATMVVASNTAGIIIYHKRKALVESRAKGWWPQQMRAEGLRG